MDRKPNLTFTSRPNPLHVKPTHGQRTTEEKSVLSRTKKYLGCKNNNKTQTQYMIMKRTNTNVVLHIVLLLIQFNTGAENFSERFFLPSMSRKFSEKDI